MNLKVIRKGYGYLEKRSINYEEGHFRNWKNVM